MPETDEFGIPEFEEQVEGDGPGEVDTGSSDPGGTGGTGGDAAGGDSGAGDSGSESAGDALGGDESSSGESTGDPLGGEDSGFGESTGDAFGTDGEQSGAGEPAGPADGQAAADPEHPPLPVLDSDGNVVDTAVWDPDLGAYVTSKTETTVVQEYPDQPITSAGAANPAASPDVSQAPGGGIPFYINPDVFDFRKTAENWQETSCVPIVFGYGSPFLPMTVIRVGIRVGAPIKLRDNRTLTPREAQLDSANAGQAAAAAVVALLDADALDPSGIQPRFVGFFGGAIMATGIGYRATGCYPA